MMAAQHTKYSKSKLEKFKKMVSQELKATTGQLDQLKADRNKQKKHIAATNLDFNENSKHFQQQAKQRRHIRRLQRRERELKAALHRIEDGTYGVCERTGKLIREERLEAMPTARFELIKK